MSLIKDLVLVVAAMITAVSAAVTACAARKGINKWSVELRERTRLEVARGIMRAAYKLRDAVKSCRFHVVSGEEFPDDYGSGNPTSEPDQNAWEYVFKNRWAPVREALQDYDARALEAEVLWGSEICDSSDKLHAEINELFFATVGYFENHLYSEETSQADGESEKTISSIVFSKSPNNKLSKSIDEAIKELKQKVKQPPKS